MSKTTHAQLTATLVATLAAAAGLLAVDVAHAEDKAAAYKMVVFSDQRHGVTVAKGKYEKAIEKLTAKPERKRDAFETRTNLCVAYTKSGELEKATASCDAALALIREKQARTASPSADVELANERSLALALSNRGVLYAVHGDHENARSNFEEAMGLKARLAVPKRNLARLDRAVESEQG